MRPDEVRRKNGIRRFNSNWLIVIGLSQAEVPSPDHPTDRQALTD